MKHIQKDREPPAFSAWKDQANADWTPTFRELRGALKQTVKTSLMAEQGDLCCYCERRLTADDSHIEHFRPQHDPAVDALDYANLLCSCQQHLDKGVPRHCGNLKGGWFDPALLISPLDPTCEERFAFTADGYIQPGAQTDQAAATTINKLGLDIPKLRAFRKSVIDPFLEDSLTEADLETLVKDYLDCAPGKFNEFWTTIRHLFGAYAA